MKPTTGQKGTGDLNVMKGLKCTTSFKVWGVVCRDI